MLEALVERVREAGLAGVGKDVVGERVGGGGEDTDELGLVAARFSPESIDELCDALLECGGAACLPDMSAMCGVGERELLALVLALQQRGSPLAFQAFRLHVATTPRARLNALVLVGFVRACRALNKAPGGAGPGVDAAPPDGALDAVLRELRDALRIGERLALDSAQSVTEAACELLRSGQLVEASSKQDAFDVLGCLLPEHAQTVFRALVPMLALTLEGAASATVARDAARLQKMACEFACDALAAAGDEEAVLHSALALVQHSMTSTPDKADFRAAVAKSASAIVACMPDEHVARFVGFVGRLARNAKPQNRTMACESALEALLAPALAHVPKEALVDVLLEAMRDKSTSVRARAVGALATLVERGAGEEAEAAERGALLRLLEVRSAHLAAALASGTAPTGGGAVGNATASPVALTPEEGSSQQITQQMDGTPLLLQLIVHPAANDEATDGPSGALASSPPACSLRAALIRRCRDSKPVVRKVAVSALTALSLASVEPSVDASTLAVLGARCRDTSLAVRKAAASALATLFEAAAEAPAGGSEAAEAAGRAWLTAVAPLIVDGETSVRELCAGAISSYLLAPIASGAPVRASLAWRTLGSCDQPTTEHLRRVCARLAAIAGALPRGLGRALQGCLASRTAPDGEPLGASARAAAWGLLEEIAASKLHAKELRAADLAAAWTAPHSGASTALVAARALDDVDAVGSLQVVVELSRKGLLARGASEALLPSLKAELLAERASPQLARAVAHAYAAAATTAGLSPKAAWRDIVERCEAAICARASGGTPELATGGQPSASPAVEAVLARVFLAGEIGLLCAGGEGSIDDPLPARLVRALEAEAVPPRSGALPLFCEASPAQLALAERAALQAQAIVALGKLAASRPALGKRLVPMLVSELHESESAAVRNNCLFVLADLLTHYTALVDRHVPLLALAMADSEALVRFHSVVLVSRLLLADFVRWKPLVLRAFALALADPEERVRDVAQHCVVEQLLPRQPQMLVQGLVELSAHLNGCACHPSFVRTAALSAPQEARLQLAGQANRERRAAIYATLARAMPDELRVSAFHKLVSEVLAPAADGSLRLADAGVSEMLADALLLLATGALRLPTARAGAGAGADADDVALDEIAAAATAPSGGAAAARASGARAKVVAAASAKLCAEGALPVAIELRRALEEARSPLLGLLMVFVRELVRENKELLADLAQRDREFALEIEFDLGRQPARPADAADGRSAAGAENGPASQQPAEPAARSHPPRRRAVLEEKNGGGVGTKMAPPRQAAGDTKRSRKGRSSQMVADTPAEHMLSSPN